MCPKNPHTHPKIVIYWQKDRKLRIFNSLTWKTIKFCTRIKKIWNLGSDPPPLALKWRTFSSTCSTSPIIMKFYQLVRSMKRSKFAKFRNDIINIDGVMTSLIIRHDVKILWRHISVKNVGIALKLCTLFDLVLAIIYTV